MCETKKFAGEEICIGTSKLTTLPQRYLSSAADQTDLASISSVEHCAEKTASNAFVESSCFLIGQTPVFKGKQKSFQKLSGQKEIFFPPNCHRADEQHRRTCVRTTERLANVVTVFHICSRHNNPLRKKKTKRVQERGLRIFFFCFVLKPHFASRDREAVLTARTADEEVASPQSETEEPCMGPAAKTMDLQHKARTALLERC